MSLSILTAAEATAETVLRLPRPARTGGMPLMQALAERHSSRDFAATALPAQLLSNLLWAAFGYNRPDGRTAPSAHGVQEMEVYVVLRDGAYLYGARDNTLTLVRAGDLRALTGKQDFVAQAPLNLVYVADLTHLGRDPDVDKHFYAAADAGHISENVYLFAAAHHLAVVTRAYIDKPALAKALGLKPQHEVVLAQSVGFPKHGGLH
ncbi:MAG: SagB/ThcOx family dehydrogenase [Telluria sp.]